jgi:hypothetical protein
LYESRDNGEIGFDEGLETLGDQVKNTIANHG